MTEIREAWIVGAVRTPIGRHGGALSPVRPDDLGAIALEALMDSTGVPPSEVEDVYFGCANQAGEDNRDVARMSRLSSRAFPRVWPEPPSTACAARASKPWRTPLAP